MATSRTVESPRGTARVRILTWLPLGLAAAVFFLLARFHLPSIGDDSFIAFRYAVNFAHGHGLVWNAGERPVEGFSSPLWLGLLSVGAILGADVAIWARWLGVAAAAAAVAGTFSLARRLGAGTTLAGAAALGAAFVLGLHYWAPAGLETALMTALVVWTCAGVAACAATAGPIARRASTRASAAALADTEAAASAGVARPTSAGARASDLRTAPWLVPAALLGVTRPEGPILVVVALLSAMVARGRHGVTWRQAVIAISPAAAWFAFRMAYYGAPLPNSYYAKATGPLGQRLGEGFAYAGWLLVPLALAAAAWAWRREPRDDRAAVASDRVRAGEVRRGALAALLLPACSLAVTIGGGGDWMQNGRLLVPVLLPVLASGVALASRRDFGGGILPVIRRGTPPGPPRGILARTARGTLPGIFPALAVVALIGARAFAPPAALVEAARGRTLPVFAWQEGSLVPVSRQVAAWVAERYPAGTLIAVNHAGIIPYALLSFHAIDMTGLSDAHIARDVSGGLHQKFDPDYVLAREPRLIVLNSRAQPGIGGIWYHHDYWQGENALVDRPEFQRWYRPVRYWSRMAQGGAPSYILLFERAPSPQG